LAVATAIEFSEIHRISSEKYHEFIECGALDKAHVGVGEIPVADVLDAAESR
jgi:hypothetical protein